MTELAVAPEQASASEPWRPWLTAWLGGSVLAVANGGVRDVVLVKAIEEEPARQLSTLTLLILLTAYMWLLHRRWPITQVSTAFRVGLAWVAMTLVFEFGLGHYVEGKSWSTLLSDYDVTSGHIWVLVPLWVSVAPALIRWVQRRRT